MLDVTRNATAADGSPIPLQFLDVAGDATRLVSAHVMKNGAGVTINPATDEAVQGLGAALGSDGSSPPALPGGATGIRGWLRQIASLLAAPPAASLAPGENHLGEIGGRIVNASASFTRPADTVSYAIGDLVANGTTAGAVVPLSLAVCRAADRSAMLRRVQVRISDAAWLNAALRVHLFRVAPTVTNGDNGAFLASESQYLGACDVTLDRSFNDPAVKGFGVPMVGSEISIQPASGTAVIYALIELRSAVTPASGAVVTLTAEIHQN